MGILNCFSKKVIVFLTGVIILSFLASCGIWDPADSRKVSPNSKERVKKNLEEGKGLSLKGLVSGSKGGTNYQFASSNPMWRATLEILDFLPLANVDYSGGIITTDWYNEGTTSDESIKITVRFLTNEIRSDGIKVLLHKKICNTNNNCTINKIDNNLAFNIQDKILKTAALMKQKNDIILKKRIKKKKKTGRDAAQRRKY